MTIGIKSRLAKAKDRFLDLYGPGEVRVLRAPARINILGEHVDYVSWLPTASLPFGSHEHEMFMLWRPGTDLSVRGASAHSAYPPFVFRPEADPPGADWAELVFSRPAPEPHWSNYARGPVTFAQWRHPGRVSRGIDFLLDSTIPPGGGSSSSSAIVVLTGAAIREANHLDYDPQSLAWDSSQAEWYLGTRGGALDHTAICLSRRGCVVFMDHHQRVNRTIPFPVDDYCWVTFFTHAADKGREVMLEYNERAAVSRLLVPALIGDSALPVDQRVARLPERLSLAALAPRFPEVFAACEAAFPALVRDRAEVPLRIRDRARHHLGESRRVEEALRLLDQLDAGDDVLTERIMRGLGRLIDLSHQSLRDLYDVTNPEVDRLVEVVSSFPAVLGRRLMGGGFGGNVLVLVRRDCVESLIDEVQRNFYDERARDASLEGSIMISTPGDGLSALSPFELNR